VGKAHPTLWSSQISTGHGAWRKRKEIISRYALGAMRYAVQLLITIPDSKGKSVQYFSHGQALSGLSFMKLTSVDQMFRFRQNTKFLNPARKEA
jgi:hypothetical protein